MRPQRRAEPGIQNILLADEAFAGQAFLCRGVLGPQANVQQIGRFKVDRQFAILRVGCGSHPVGSLLALAGRLKAFRPDRYLMAPPQLATYRPVAFFAQPIQVALGVTLGDNLDLAASDRIHSALCERVHFDEPLIGQVRLDRSLTAIAMSQIDLARFDAIHQLEGFHIGNNLLARGLDRQSLVLAGRFVQRSIGIENVDQRQAGALGDVIVVGVVCRGDLDATGPHVRLGPGIDNQGHFSFDQRYADFATGQCQVAQLDQFRQDGRLAFPQFFQLFFQQRTVLGSGFGNALLQRGQGSIHCCGGIRVNSHSRVAQHGFRPRSSDRHKLRPARGGSTIG